MACNEAGVARMGRQNMLRFTGFDDGECSGDRRYVGIVLVWRDGSGGGEVTVEAVAGKVWRQCQVARWW